MPNDERTAPPPNPVKAGSSFGLRHSFVIRHCVATVACAVWMALPAWAASVSFERDVQPILRRCLQCHGPDKAKAGLRLDSRSAATRGLRSGNHAIVSRHP